MLDELLDDSSQESEVEDLVNAVYDEIGLELNKNLVNTPQTKIKAQPKATQKEKTKHSHPVSECTVPKTEDVSLVLIQLKRCEKYSAMR